MPATAVRRECAWAGDARRAPVLVESGRCDLLGDPPPVGDDRASRSARQCGSPVPAGSVRAAAAGLTYSSPSIVPPVDKGSWPFPRLLIRGAAGTPARPRPPGCGCARAAGSEEGARDRPGWGLGVRPERSSRMQTADSPAPKVIHGATTIRSLTVIGSVQAASTIRNQCTRRPCPPSGVVMVTVWRRAFGLHGRVGARSRAGPVRGSSARGPCSASRCGGAGLGQTTSTGPLP